jgi:hypothetical protein
MARPEGSPAWVVYQAVKTNKADSEILYNKYRKKGFVQGILLRNLTTGEVLRAEITGNRVAGRRGRRTVLK